MKAHIFFFVSKFVYRVVNFLWVCSAQKSGRQTWLLNDLMGHNLLHLTLEFIFPLKCFRKAPFVLIKSRALYRPRKSCLSVCWSKLFSYEFTFFVTWSTFLLGLVCVFAMGKTNVMSYRYAVIYSLTPCLFRKQGVMTLYRFLFL